MARRKRKEEDADWVAPEFDEVAYMRREIEGARAAVLTIGWAVVGAIVSFLLYAVHPAVAFVGGIAVGYGLVFMLPLLGVKTDAFKRRDWTGHGITYFFSWLAFWIILLNPPFGDFTIPSVQGVSVSPYNASLVPSGLLCAAPSGSVSVPGAGNNSIYLLFQATDNKGLARLLVEVTPETRPKFNASTTRVTTTSPCRGHQGEPVPDGTYNVTFAMTATRFNVAITATDSTGRSARVAFVINVS